MREFPPNVAAPKCSNSGRFCRLCFSCYPGVLTVSQPLATSIPARTAKPLPPGGSDINRNTNWLQRLASTFEQAVGQAVGYQLQDLHVAMAQRDCPARRSICLHSCGWQAPRARLGTRLACGKGRCVGVIAAAIIHHDDLQDSARKRMTQLLEHTDPAGLRAERCMFEEFARVPIADDYC